MHLDMNKIQFNVPESSFLRYTYDPETSLLFVSHSFTVVDHLHVVEVVH